MVINIQVKQKKGFVRTGQDVVYYMTISFPQAVLGAVINVPTAYGTVNCEIPAGIKPGEQLCLAGYSFKNKKKGRYIMCTDLFECIHIINFILR